MSASERGERPFHVLVWGATGFTGRLVAEYLLRRHGVGAGLRWAIGGRSREKLERVRAELAAIDPAAAELALLVGDAGDRGALSRVVGQASVVASTVGPFALHGLPLVEACVDHGTHYADITGEPQFVRASIDACHERARAAGVRVVHCCGYDSVPSDLGVLMVQDAMIERSGEPCAEIKFMAGESRGGFSGGTVASMLHLAEGLASDPALRRLLANPYVLDPEHVGRGPDGADQRGVRHDADLGQWTGPFVMAAINSRVVRRTHALLGRPWGEGFRYAESMSFGRGPRGMALAAATAAALGGGALALGVPALRTFLRDRVLPAPGEGPSREARESGFFVSRLVGLPRRPGGPRLLGVVRGTSDPGYGETSKMLGEAAACLAVDDLASSGGVLTPAYAMGRTLIDRLRSAGMTFEVRELP